MSTRTLSKSDFKLARTCEAKLYFRENGYADNRDFNPYLALLANGGYMVESLAKARYDDGVQLAYGRDVHDDFRRTMELLGRENVTLFEATVLVGRRQARIDILEKKGHRVRLIEVKSKSFDGDAHAASLAQGGFGELRNKRRPNPVAADWEEYVEDVAYQTLLLEAVMPNATITPFLALVDKSKAAGVDGVPALFELTEQSARFIGTREQLARLDLVTEVDVSAEVALVRDVVAGAASRFETKLDAPLAQHLHGVERGAKCRGCEFRLPDGAPSGFQECWGDLAHASPHMLDLYSIGKAKAPDGTLLADWMVTQRRASLIDIPLDGLVKSDGTVGALAERQRRQIEYTRRGEVYVSRALRDKIALLRGPVHFIDFEASQLALPYHTGMRPYGKVAFQWSCHTVPALGAAPTHAEWLNDVDVWPNQSFAESLRAAIGNDGLVLTWSKYESITLKQIVADLERFGRDAPELVQWISDVVNRRVVDLHEWAQADFFHPAMGGRTGIKFVMDALWKNDAVMRQQFEEWTGLSADASRDPYASLPPVEIAGVLQDVHEGTGAMRAYQEMMYGAQRHDAGVRARWAKLLRQYCHLDTLSMVLILEHWRRASTA